MKKFFVFLLILILVLGAGLTIFILSFDLDHYRPQVISQIESALGKPADLEKISLGFHGGLAVELKGLAVYKDASRTETLIRLKSANAVVALKPLLSREISVSSIYLQEPFVHVVRGRDGKIKGSETVSKSQPSKPGAGSASTGEPSNAALLPFLIERIKIEDGEVFFRDELPGVPVETSIRDIQINFKNVAADAPVDFQVEGSVFGGNENLKINGNVTVSPERNELQFSGVNATVKLDDMRKSDLFRFFPDLERSGLVSVPSGNLHLEVRDFAAGPEGLKKMSAEAKFTGGRIELANMPHAAEAISFDATASQSRIKIENLTARMAGGQFAGALTVNLDAPKPITAFDMKATRIGLSDFLKPGRSGDPELQGTLSLSFQGTLTGSGPDALRTLGGQGQILLEEPVVKNLNLLKEVFGKFSLIPGLAATLEERLSPEYKEKFRERDTYLETIDWPFSASQGALTFNSIALRTDTFRLQGAGGISLDRMFLNARTMLLIDPELSMALMRSVNELQYLADAEGNIQIPLNIQGPLPKISVAPDLQYVGSKLAISKTRDVLNDLFKKPEPEQPSPDGQAAVQGSEGTQPRQQTSLFGQLLQTAIEGTGSGQNNSQEQGQPQ